MKFIDLFAGLGGFHQALASFDAECVFASEINPGLSDLYEKNFGIKPRGDIRDVDVQDIPVHQILCAGFPCQPFSKAGNQRGLQCPQWGDLIEFIFRILDVRKPRYFIIENVPNLMCHSNGATWELICDRLRILGYDISFEKLSPHIFGVPQKRERAFIVGDREGLKGFAWPRPATLPELSISSILDDNPPDALRLNENHERYLTVWQEFIQAFPKDIDLPSFPVWAMEFGANYPLKGPSPYKQRYKGLGSYRGAFGVALNGMSSSQVEASLPNYARTKLDEFPAWKVNFIEKNRNFYMERKELIDSWIYKIKSFPPSFQKLEWNIKGGERDIWQHVIQFRASGIRVKRMDVAPSLIAMTTSQVPIIAWQKRYMTPRECSRLQSMDKLKYLRDTKDCAYKAFGNAVNVEVVKQIVDALVVSRARAKERTLSVAVAIG